MAEIVTEVGAATAVVVIVNTGEAVTPAATVTEAGTVALGSLLDSVTTAPPAGAGLFSVTLFNAVETPPTTDVGDKTGVATNGFTVRFAVFVTPV